ncbi:MAG TPA: nucleotide exchange factor GrpE [Chloroflexota bacterium]|nr:nucleotide exchange factor GrpE [Chloroflexota bacterium]
MTEETPTQPDQESAPGDEIEVKWRKKERPQREAPAMVEDVATLRQDLTQAQERIKELEARVHRSAADLSNLRKRTEAEREDMERFATMRLVSELLPVLDNFERALTTIPGDLARLTWIHGIILIERHLQAILERQGLAPIEAAGKPFSPYEHEAISEKETADAAPGTVVQELQTGYTMHGRVIRPSLVEIARAPSEQTPEAGDTAAEVTEPSQAEEIANAAETENVGP